MNETTERPAVGLMEAAQMTGKARSTIRRAVTSGRLSTRTDSDGRTVYDVAELARVFGALHVGEVARDGADATQRATAQREKLQAMERENELLRDQLRQLENTLEDTRYDRDQWRQQATALLTDQREKPEVTQPEQRQSLWQRLFG